MDWGNEYTPFLFIVQNVFGKKIGKKTFHGAVLVNNERKINDDLR